MLVLGGLVGLHRINQLQNFSSITGWDIDLDYCDIEWFALETNRDHSWGVHVYMINDTKMLDLIYLKLIIR